jgi:hypothetical protein
MTAAFSKEQLIAAIDGVKAKVERSSKDMYTAEEFAEMISQDRSSGERFIVPLIIIIAILLYSQEAN